MARTEYGFVEAEEMYWNRRVGHYRGEVDTHLGLIKDEGAQIDMICEAAKALLPQEVAAGFKDASHLMKYIVGVTAAPAPIDVGPDGGTRELAAV